VKEEAVTSRVSSFLDLRHFGGGWNPWGFAPNGEQEEVEAAGQRIESEVWSRGVQEEKRSRFVLSSPPVCCRLAVRGIREYRIETRGALEGGEKKKAKFNLDIYFFKFKN
jgi:hypothetical protein